MSYPEFDYDATRPIDVICMGRVAVDLYSEQIGCSLAESSTFKKYLGGCAGNIAVGTARLGLKSSMFSCVGQDEMGTFLLKELQKEGVDTSLVRLSQEHLTGLVLLGIKPPADFPLMFYRKECADMQLKASDITFNQLKASKVLLITGTGFSTSAMFETSMAVLYLAQEAQTKVVLDLDYRPVLWGLTPLGNGENRYCASKEVSATYQKMLSFCDLLVGTEEEICIAGGKECVAEALVVIAQYTKAPVVIKTGEKGCSVYFPQLNTYLSTKPFPVEVLNVLGAGDGFMSGLLAGLLRAASWESATTYANACGALVVTRHGCAPAIPFKDELDYFIREFDNNPRVWASPLLAKLHDKSLSACFTNTLNKKPEGFSQGLNTIVRMDNNQNDAGMNFYSLKLNPGDAYTFNQVFEFAALLMTGRIEFNYSGHCIQAERTDYFSQAPQVLHCSSGVDASVRALTCAEILIIETVNTQQFDPVFFDGSNLLEMDHRGKGLLEDTSYRLVRTVFDKRNRPESNLVLGEIITFQGRWSSYPSHYHAQPEIYHYRFSEPQGYAFGEKGREVLRIEHNDTYQIPPGLSHAHTTAPGYALYTLWFIRHLENNPYTTPTFSSEHAWTRSTDANLRSFGKL